MTERRTLPQIDAAIDAARASQEGYGDGMAGALPELLRAAESMRSQLFGSHRDDVDPMPVFVLRGRDALAPGVVDAYRRECDRHDLADQARQVLLAFEEMAAWQRRNWTLVKLPDHTHVEALPHASDKAPLLGRLFEQDSGTRCSECTHLIEQHDGEGCTVCGQCSTRAGR